MVYTRHKMHRQWKYRSIPLLMCLFFSYLSHSHGAGPERNDQQKQKQCDEEKIRLEKEMEEALSKLTKPTQDQIKNLTDNMEKQLSAGICGSLSTSTGVSDDEVKAWLNKTKFDPREFYEMTKKLNTDTLKAALKNATEDMNLRMITGLGEELVKKLGGVRKIKVADVQDLGTIVVYIFAPGEYKYVSNDVFKFILDQIHQATDKMIKADQAQNASALTPRDMAGVSGQIMAISESSRIKALCGRAFRLYSSSKDINSVDGWKNIKFLMFCAPPKVCKSVDTDLVQNAVDSLAILPWTCPDIRRLQKSNQYGPYMQMVTTANRLFPSNKPCGKFLAEKMVNGGKSVLKLDSMEALGRLNFLAACLPDKTLTKAIDDIGCSFGSQLMGGPALTERLSKYLAKKCATTPIKIDEVTCTSLETDYEPYLKTMKRSFFKSLPKNVACETKCLDLFKATEDFPKDVMKFIMKQCYQDSATITADDVKNLGGLVTDLPLDKFDQIKATDLETNIKSIKKDLKAAKKQRGKKAVVKKLAKKMIADGKMSDLVDSKEIMKEVSLKDLKTSLSTSTDIIKDLGIGNTNETLGFTNSQKKWVVRQVVKNKAGSNFTVEDLREMKSLVTGLLSSHIKKMGQAHSADTGGIELAREMCTHTDWPRKSLEAINKYLIQSGLKVRNSSNPMSSLTVMDVEGLGCQCLLNFNTSEYGYMDQGVCSAVCMKIGYCDIFRCLNPTRRKNVLQACLKCKNLGSQMITNTDFDELGPNLISQMSQAQLDLVPAQVLQSHIEFFKDICMDQTLRSAVLKALQAVIGSSGTDYEPETLYLLGSAIKVLPKTLLEQLDKTVIADMQTTLMEELVPATDEEINLNKCCEKWLNTTDLQNLKDQNFNVMLTVKEAFFADSELSRKKRSTFIWTCRQIRPLPVLFATASAKEIDLMDNKELVDCLEIIGQMQNLKRWQHELLLAKAQTALSKKVCNMTVNELQQLGVIALAFSVQDISCLRLNDESLISSLGDLEGWNTKQLVALAARYMSSKGLSNLSTLESSNITMLGPIICGFTVSHIATISPAEFRNNGADIGSMAECDLDHWKAFVSLAVQDDAYGPISTWKAEDVNDLKFIIAGLSGSDITELAESAIEGLDVDVIPLIPRDVFKNNSLAQLQSFSNAQASAVTNSQRVVLTAEQNAILDIKVDIEPVIGAGTHHSGTISAPVLGKVFGSVMIMVAIAVQSIAVV